MAIAQAAGAPADPPLQTPVAPTGPALGTSAPTSFRPSGDDTTAWLLQLLGDASNPTLVACFTAVVFSVVIIFGGAGLLLLGIVAGCLLHAAWSNSNARHSGDIGHLGKAGGDESSLSHAKRVLGLHQASTSSNAEPDTSSEAQDKLEKPSRGLDLSKLPPETGAALASFTDAVMRDYVSWWYTPILPAEQSFILACRDVFSSFVCSMYAHVSRKRPADTFLEVLANSSSLLIVFLSEFAAALSPSQASGVSTAADIRGYVSSHPDSSLASILDATAQEQKLHAAADDLLKRFLESQVYSCRPAKIFLQEVISGVVLKLTLERCSQPDWINSWIVYLLEKQSEGAASTTGNTQDLSQSRTSEEILSGTASNGQMLPSPSPDAHEGSSSKGGAEQRLSDAEAAMAQAIFEAEKMNELIEEDARRRRANAVVDGGELLGASAAAPSSNGRLNGTDSGRPDVTSRNSSTAEGFSHKLRSEQHRRTPFTSFDDFVPDPTPTALRTSPSYPLPGGSDDEPSQSLLQDANVVIMDNSSGKSTSNSKANLEYIIQIEPTITSQPGWMIARKYADFETLHEVLRRISVVSGVEGFQQRHAALPQWKGRTKTLLVTDLEIYLRDALSYQQLADSEGMKRFLEKDHAVARSAGASGRSGLPAAFGNMGKGVLDALASAPKGVGGVLGGVSPFSQRKENKLTGRTSFGSAAASPDTQSRAKAGKVRSSTDIRTGNDAADASKSLPSLALPMQQETGPQTARSSTDDALVEAATQAQGRAASSSKAPPDPNSSQSSSAVNTPQQSPLSELADISLPPLPSDIPDDYGSTPDASTPQPRRSLQEMSGTSAAGAAAVGAYSEAEAGLPLKKCSAAAQGAQARPKAAPLTEEETQVAVDLLFAVVNELYNLSSAWNIRRTLLMAAKNFLKLDTIRSLIQETVIDANTTDAAVGGYIQKLEANAVPTAEQLKAWPPPPSEEEKAATRAKARRLLMERGLPPALTGVMGNAASREALGRVFDCLQVEEVARGLMFGLMMQLLRVLSQ